MVPIWTPGDYAQPGGVTGIAFLIFLNRGIIKG